MALTASRVKQRYLNCLSESKRVLEKLGCSVAFSSLNIAKDGSDLVNVGVEEPIYFKDWAYRPKSKARIDILASFIESIRLSDGVCVSSAVTVNYLHRSGQECYACDAIKYDYCENAEAQHPICHAQNQNSVLPLPESFPKDRQPINQQALGQRHQVARIPTAFVNLAGLLAKIVADHLNTDAYAEYWTACEKVVGDIPCHSRLGGMPRIKGSECIRSRYWYPS